MCQYRVNVIICSGKSSSSGKKHFAFDDGIFGWKALELGGIIKLSIN